MSRIVELSTGEVVYLKDKYTRKAEKAYKLASEKGVIIREEITKDGVMTRTKEVPAENAEKAADIMIVALVEKIVKNSGESSPDEAWLDGLLHEDYQKLGDMALEIYKEAMGAIGAGKKK